MVMRSLVDDFDLAGDWHLPDAPDKKVAGNLTYRQGKIELTLNASLTPIFGDRQYEKVQCYPTIYGRSRDAEAVTVLKAFRANGFGGFSSGGDIEYEHISSSLLITGAHVTNNSLYDEARFRIPGLQVWLSSELISHVERKENDAGCMTNVFCIKSGERIITPIESMDLFIYWTRRFTYRYNKYNEVHVDISGWISIIPKEPKDLSWYFLQQQKVTTMLTILAGTPMVPDSVEATVANTDSKFPTRISVLVASQEPRGCEFKDPEDFFMSRARMNVDICTVVARWFEEFQTLDRPSQLAFSIFTTKHFGLHIEFLTLMQALEGLHRALYKGLFIDQKSYETSCEHIIESIPSDIQGDHRRALCSRIQFGNEISLDRKLKELAFRLPVEIRLKIFGSDKKVPRKWINTRNYYTHWDNSLREKILDDKGMHTANKSMRMFLRVLYIGIMQIPDESVVQALENLRHMSKDMTYESMMKYRDNFDV